MVVAPTQIAPVKATLPRVSKWPAQPAMALEMHMSHDPELEEGYSDVIGLILATMLAEVHGPRIHAVPLAA